MMASIKARKFKQMPLRDLKAKECADPNTWHACESCRIGRTQLTRFRPGGRADTLLEVAEVLSILRLVRPRDAPTDRSICICLYVLRPYGIKRRLTSTLRSLRVDAPLASALNCQVPGPLQPSRAAVALSWALCRWDCTLDVSVESGSDWIEDCLDRCAIEEARCWSQRMEIND